MLGRNPWHLGLGYQELVPCVATGFLWQELKGVQLLNSAETHNVIFIGIGREDRIQHSLTLNSTLLELLLPAIIPSDCLDSGV